MRCGVVFAKFHRRQQPQVRLPAAEGSEESGRGWLIDRFMRLGLRTRVRLLTVVVIAVFAYSMPYIQRLSEKPASSVFAGFTDENGFVTLPPPNNQADDAVWVIAAVNCPEADAQRADQLTKLLKEKKIPAFRKDDVSFKFASRDPGLSKRLDAMMEGPLPIVFVRGRAKGNPSLEAVVAEYGKTGTGPAN
jgi:hypothetical protein